MNLDPMTEDRVKVRDLASAMISILNYCISPGTYQYTRTETVDSFCCYIIATLFEIRGARAELNKAISKFNSIQESELQVVRSDKVIADLKKTLELLQPLTSKEADLNAGQSLSQSLPPTL